MLSIPMFQEIFAEMVEYVVERVQSNYALQVNQIYLYMYDNGIHVVYVRTLYATTRMIPPPPPPPFQIIPNSFLANASTSAAFAGILLNFLLKHMEELGSE